MKLPDEFVAQLIEAQLSGEEHMVIKLPNGRETCSCFFTWNESAISAYYNEREVIKAYSSRSISKTAPTESSAVSDSLQHLAMRGSSPPKKAGS